MYDDNDIMKEKNSFLEIK